MNDLPIQSMSELVRGVIEILWSRPDGLAGNEVMRLLPEVIKLTNHETGLSSTTRLPDYVRRARLATLPLVRAGWLVKTDRGRWFITEDGRDACRRYSRPQELLQEAIRLSEINDLNIPEILMSLELIQEEVWEYIAKYIQQKNIVEIRRLIAALFDVLQYHVVWIAPPQKNRGLIDMVANLDPLGAKNQRILVQVRHTGQPVTVEGYKSFSAILGVNDYGLLFSTSGFTTEVKNIFNKGGYQKINAMDLEKFYEIWIKHYAQLSREAHVLLPLRAIFFLSPAE